MGYYTGPYHRGIHLPHYDQGRLLHMITYRLGDSLPDNVLLRLEHETAELPQEQRGIERKRRVEYWLDQGHGSCLLRHLDCARYVKNAWEFHDGKYYDLDAWVVMPNHVHLLMEVYETSQLEKIIRMWKTFSCRLINKRVGRKGTLWMPDYFDRYIRDARHFANARAYLEKNVRKGGVLWHLPGRNGLQHGAGSGR